MRHSLKKIVQCLAIALSVSSLSACVETSETKTNAEKTNHTAQANPELWPKLTSKVGLDTKMEAKIADILAKMTVEQKIAQMIQPEIRAFTVEDMRKYGFGSYLNGGGAFPDNNKYATMADWVALADKLYEASVDDSVDGNAIPTMWGTDAVHGHNNVIGATYYPHNIGLGAMHNPALMKKIGAATAKVVEVTGIDWAFAPTVAVVRDDRWGRTYEGYSEDPELVKSYAAEMVAGMQGDVGSSFLGDGKVIATAKHFLGDGGTHLGDDQGDNLSTEQQLIDIHAPGYVSAIDAGVQTIMASFNTWHYKKMHGNESLLTDVLKGQMGFDGLVVGDWDGHGQVKGCNNESCAQAIIAGVDIIMVPNSWKPMYENTIAQVNSGEIPMARIDDAVTRILRVKMRANLFDRGAPSKRKYASDSKQIGSTEHRELAREAVRESLVMLKNKNNVLPLSRNMNVLVAGDGADNIGKQSGGWSISWQGTGNLNSDFPGATSIYKGINDVVSAAGGKTSLNVRGEYSERPDVAIVVFGENPYAEGEGDLANLEYQKKSKMDIKILEKLKADGIPVVSVFITGRPMWVNRELNASDAFVVAWLPGTEGQGVADVLFKDAQGKVNYDVKGRLSYSWPKIDTQAVVNRNDAEYSPLFEYGYGLSYNDKDTLADNLNIEPELKLERSANDPLDIFKNRALDGLTAFVGDKKSWSMPVAHSIVTTLDSDNLTYRYYNWVVQEDARRVTWTGQSKAITYLAYDSPRDLAAYVGTGSSLSFDVRVDQAPTASLEVGIDCGESCGGSVAIDHVLKTKTAGEWSKVTVDLSCLVKAGAQFEHVLSPFVLSSAGKADLIYANVSFIPNSAKDADVSCTE